jgi:hypothetical protein
MFLSSFASISKTQSDTDHNMTHAIIRPSVTEEAQVQYQIRSGGSCRGESDPGTVTLPRIVFSPFNIISWIDLVQNRDRWWVLANAVLNLRVP